MTLPAANHAAASASEVINLIRRFCRPLAAERVSLANAGGRILREPVRATEDQPAFDRSSVDGFAVRMDDHATRFRVVDEIRAGDWKPRRLQAGETVHIATGGALPDDGLQVVMREDTERTGEFVSVLRRDPERNLRFRGEDAATGQMLVEPGIRLQPGTLGLLASVGCVQPLVTRLPQVLHLATGNEIVPPQETPPPGQIRDSNSTLVRAFLDQWRIQPTQFHVPEDEVAARAVLEASACTADLIFISGGASVGEHDFTRRLLEQFGFTIHVSRTTARPGKPLILAQQGNTLAFGLPGNPLAHFVCLNLYVRAALEALAGRPAESIWQTGKLMSELSADGNARETFWPAHWQLREGVAALTSLCWSSSGDLTSLASANALIRAAPGEERLERDSWVDFVPTEIIA